jgi:hypothetical protein
LSNLNKHAVLEFKAAGWLNEDGSYKDEMQGMICEHVLTLLRVFSDEGHSGTTAPYAIRLFSRLASFEPLVPLTGEDWEWNEVSERMGSRCWQNKRASHVFKDENGAYDINGKVFWEWAMPYEEGGEPYKSYYTCRESRVPVTFPYVVPEKPEYVYRHSDATPQQPAQNENGFIN